MTVDATIHGTGNRAPDGTPETKHYFVDEAGDGVLFNAKGKVIIGTEGCSNFFMVGLADVPYPAALETDLKALRADLLADPLMRGVRQMNPERGQTAVFFHANEDPVEVRREVFRVLLRHDRTIACSSPCAETARTRRSFAPPWKRHGTSS